MYGMDQKDIRDFVFRHNITAISEDYIENKVYNRFNLFYHTLTNKSKRMQTLLFIRILRKWCLQISEKQSCVHLFGPQ